MIAGRLSPERMLAVVGCPVIIADVFCAVWAVTEFRSYVIREVGPGSHSLPHSSPVPNKPYGF